MSNNANIERELAQVATKLEYMEKHNQELYERLFLEMKDIKEEVKCVDSKVVNLERNINKYKSMGTAVVLIVSLGAFVINQIGAIRGLLR